jgi:hypothetical protein
MCGYLSAGTAIQIHSTKPQNMHKNCVARLKLNTSVFIIKLLNLQYKLQSSIAFSLADLIR